MKHGIDCVLVPISEAAALASIKRISRCTNLCTPSTEIHQHDASGGPEIPQVAENDQITVEIKDFADLFFQNPNAEAPRRWHVLPTTA